MVLSRSLAENEKYAIEKRMIYIFDTRDSKVWPNSLLFSKNRRWGRIKMMGEEWRKINEIERRSKKMNNLAETTRLWDKFALSAKSFWPRCAWSFLPSPFSRYKWLVEDGGTRRSEITLSLGCGCSGGEWMANQGWAPFKPQWILCAATERHLTDPKDHPLCLPLTFIRHRTLSLPLYQGLYFKC